MANSWLWRGVLRYAHQGGALEGPSSTLFAIDQALAKGANAIELDVHESSDGVLVVCHDQTVDRTSNGSGAIASLTYDELALLDNAYWFVPGENAVHGRKDEEYVYRGRGPSDLDFGIATLSSVLERYPAVPLNLDIKQSAPAVRPYEEHLAAELASHGRVTDVIVTSFDDSTTARFKHFAPAVATAPGVSALTLGVQAIRRGDRPDPSVFEGHVALQLPDRVAGQPLIDERLVEVVHQLELALHVWTVDDPAEMARLAELGVDGIMTDVPSVLASVLEGTVTKRR